LQPFILTKSFLDTKLVRAALTSFYGIGPLVASRIMSRHHIHETAKIGTLPNQKLLDITAELTTMKIENDKRREMRDNIKLLREMGTYRGRRHAMGLPVRGQNTKSGQVSIFIFGERAIAVPFSQNHQSLMTSYRFSQREDSTALSG
jgi:small subunit ribosomal protein S13